MRWPLVVAGDPGNPGGLHLLVGRFLGDDVVLGLALGELGLVAAHELALTTPQRSRAPALFHEDRALLGERRKLLIFTEPRDTLEYLASKLRSHRH